MSHEHAQKLVISVSEAGQLLGLSRNSAYEAVRRGDIPAVRVLSRWLVPRAALEAMLARSQRKATAGKAVAATEVAEDAGDPQN